MPRRGRNNEAEWRPSGSATEVIVGERHAVVYVYMNEDVALAQSMVKPASTEADPEGLDGNADNPITALT